MEIVVVILVVGLFLLAEWLMLRGAEPIWGRSVSLPKPDMDDGRFADGPGGDVCGGDDFDGGGMDCFF